MFTGWLSRGIVGLAAAVMAPVALACENPDNFAVALRKSPPLNTDPGEVVLELDVSSSVSIEEPPTVVKFDDEEMAFANSFGVYKVKRVVAGHFDGGAAKIRYGMNSCWMLGFKGANFVVGQPEVDDAGDAYFRVHHQTYPEAVAEFSANKAAN